MTSTPEPLGALPFHPWAPTPPMGWNSWDCFGTTVAEEQIRAQAAFMGAELALHGWQYIVVDIQWYEPNALGHGYRTGAALTLDPWGRLLPAPNRFPSSVGGVGFRALADYVHTRGLKFGLHLMRGVPRQAVAERLPIRGVPQCAADIADRSRVCRWNPDMFGIDMTRPGAQAYYDSVFELFAAWGVDYVKMDDMSRPYHDNQAEIEAVRRAIDATGRPMVLSLSPGETPLSAAEHVKRHANLWRISDDFWDNWHALREQFARLARWNPHRGPGHWPDADMLPLGMLDSGRRPTRLTRDEQVSMMTLWCMARSPLMHGGDMTQTDDFTRALLTNPEVLAVNQSSRKNRPLFEQEGLIAWMAEVPDSHDRYLALFNARDQLPLWPENASICRELVDPDGGLGRPTADLEVDLSLSSKLFLWADDGGKNEAHPFAVWAEPQLVMAGGSKRRLTDRDLVGATAWWGTSPAGRAPGGGALSLGGHQVEHGLGAHTKAVLEFDLPRDCVRFTARVGFEDGWERCAGTRLRFLAFAVSSTARDARPGLALEVHGHALGVGHRFRVRDLWQGEELGEFVGEFSPVIPWHGAGLYRVSPA